MSRVNPDGGLGRVGAAVILSAVLWAGVVAQVEAAEAGDELLRQMVDVNRTWLERPPPEVEGFAYVSRLRDRDPEPVRVDRAGRVRGAHRQGITYASVLHAVAERPDRVRVRSMEEEGDRIRLSLQFEEPIRGGCGNGVDGHWYGYFNLGGEYAELLLDAGTLTPLRSRIGNVTETFGSFVEVGEGRRVPLSISIRRGDEMQFDWWFRVYEPGLWLLDRSLYGSERVAWTEGVEVNGAPAVLMHAEPASIEQEQVEKSGSLRLEAFLAANRHWLLPGLGVRRGLVYDYRQEDGYRERIWFAPDGWVLAQLESARDETVPSRRRAWLPDGRRITTAEEAQQFVRVEGEAGGAKEEPDELRQRDADLQALGMGLRLDCALTRLARDPDAAWAETLPAKDREDLYLLVLHWSGDARLFTGTMLCFTSWAYMHDVSYQRSEILCDAATHRPLHETDYDADGQVVGRYWFEDFGAVAGGGAPGRIRAEIPYRKDDADQTLDMAADFRTHPRWGWLLREVRSEFRGGAGGSTGTVSIVETADFGAVAAMAERVRATETVLAEAAGLGEGGVECVLPRGGAWSPAGTRAAWTDGAAESERGWLKNQDASGSWPVVAVSRARIESGDGGGMQVRLEGVSTTYLREYDVRWSLELAPAAGAPRVASVEVPVRCERYPTEFSVVVPLPAEAVPADEDTVRVRVNGLVTAFAGSYHGHGMWYRVARP